jgi:hypothetical protein
LGGKAHRTPAGDDAMHIPDRTALFVGIVLALPATAAAVTSLVHEATGLPVTAPIDAAFKALGVTNASPLPVRQAWYLGAYILAPLAGAAIAGSALIGARLRWAFGSVATVATLVAVFWTVRSLLDD